MAEAVYLLCAVASLLCAALLLRSYRGSGMKLILWTSLCFIGMAINNVLLFVDLGVAQDLDLSGWRIVTAVGSISILLYGLISSDVAR